MPPETPPAAPPPPSPLVMKELIEAAGLTDRAYLKDFADKPLDKDVATALLKKLDGAETLIGRKIGIPGADAKPDELDKFYATLRPAKAEEYEFKLGEKPDEEFVRAFRESAHFAGLSKTQTSRLVEKLTPHFEAVAQKQVAERARLDQEFDGLAKALFGDAQDKKIARVQAAIKDLAPEPVKKFAERLDNNALALVAGVVNAVLDKYAKEDDFSGGGAGAGSAGGTDKDTLIKELHTLYATPAWKDFQHADHKQTRARIDEILAHPALKT